MRSIKFKSFSSGSCGNGYFLGIFNELDSCDCGVLIDAGVSPRRVKKELAREGLCFEDISALLLTHDHNDHIRSLGSWCKHLGRPVWTPPALSGVLAHNFLAGEHYAPCRHELEAGWNELVPGRIRVRYFAVPHDASFTCGYALMLDEHKFVIMTDIGRMVPQALSLARQCDTLVIESNYDPWMLRHGPYPKDLQDRICGGHGHLSNEECADALRDIVHPGLRNIFLCHLSEHNNTPELAYRTSAEVLGQIYAPGTALAEEKPPRLCPLPRMTPSPLFIL